MRSPSAVGLDHVGEAGDRREVHAPEVGLLHHVVGGRVALEELHHVGAVVHLVGAVELDERAEGLHEAFRKLAELRVVVEDRGQNAHFPLRDGVERDRKEPVVRERICETLENALCVRALVVLGKIDGGRDFLEQDLAEERVELRILHELVHERESCEMALENRGGVRAVEEAHLARAVGLHVGRVDDVDSGLLEREFLLEIESCFGLGLGNFDDEEVEGFAAHENVVALAELLLVAFGGFGVGTAGDDAVDERGAEHALVFDPCREFRVVPVGNVLEDALLEVVAVVLDQLARNEDEALAVRRLARLEELCDLERERVGVLAVFDSGFGRVRDDEAKGFKLHRLLDLGPVAAGAEHLLDRAVLFDDLDGLAALDSAQARMVEAVAVVEDFGRRGEFVADRLDDAHRAVEVCVVVHLLHHPVDEAAEEVALSELKNLDLFFHCFFLS